MADLFAGCSDDSGDEDLKTNNAYAKRYDEWRRKEEVMKMKGKYGEDFEGADSEDSSSEEDEDEDARDWTEEHEKNFLATLSALKGKDPKIYKKDEVLFKEVAPKEVKKVEKEPKEKPMFLKDYERKIIEEEGGVYADDDDNEQVKSRFVDETLTDKLAYDQEQRELRESLKKAAWGDDDDEEDDGGLVVKKHVVRDEEAEKREDEEYLKWIKGETERLSNKKDAQELRHLKQLWDSGNEQNLDEAEKFLRDYVLNKRYMTAKEEDFKFEVDFSDDEKDIQEMAEFEHKYNFRFEDPDPEFIKRYPRTIVDSMRRKDTRRADKKAEKKQRKEQEKIQMKEEVNRLKSMKKKEIMAKIDKLRNITGAGDLEFEDGDIDGDFDPEEHDRRMAELFAKYDNQEGEDVYPELEDDADEDLKWEDWDKYQGIMNNSEDEQDVEYDASTSKVASGKLYGEDNDDSSEDGGEEQEEEESEDEGEEEADDSEDDTPKDKAGPSSSKSSMPSTSKSGNQMDGIERNEGGNLLIRGKKSSKLTLDDVLPDKKQKLRKKSKFAEVLANKRPTYDPERDKNFEKYFDEYYKLDFEDVVAGQPTRFKYRTVIPNDFGLSTEEILVAPDKELNKWCTLKKMVQYRSKEEELKDLETFDKRKDHYHLKQKIMPTVFTPEEEKMDEEVAIAVSKNTQKPEEEKKKSKSRKNKKKKKKEVPVADSGEGAEEGPEDLPVDEEGAKNGGVEEATGEDVQIPDSEEMKLQRKRKASESEVSANLNKAESIRKKARKNSETAPVGTKKSIAGKDKTGRFEKKLSKDNKFKKFGEQKSKQNGKLPKKKKSLEGAEKEGQEEKTDASASKEAVPWEQLTAKQKKNRRNALLRKKKKQALKEEMEQKRKSNKEKFKALTELNISEARMKAYGLDPKRVKGDLVYGNKAKKAQKCE